MFIIQTYNRTVIVFITRENVYTYILCTQHVFYKNQYFCIIIVFHCTQFKIKIFYLFKHEIFHYLHMV